MASWSRRSGWSETCEALTCFNINESSTAKYLCLNSAAFPSISFIAFLLKIILDEWKLISQFLFISFLSPSLSIQMKVSAFMHDVDANCVCAIDVGAIYF